MHPILYLSRKRLLGVDLVLVVLIGRRSSWCLIDPFMLNAKIKNNDFRIKYDFELHMLLVSTRHVELKHT
jgi:hypothetical protein